MSTSWMLLLNAAIAMASLLCNSGAWLWMSAKWCRIPNVSYRRALGAVALICAVNVVIHFALEWMPGEPEARERLALCLTLIAATICLRLLLRTTIRRTLAAGFITLVVSSIVAAPVLLAVRAFVMETFKIPTGSMALALIGKNFNVTCERCGLPMVIPANERDQMQRRARGLPATGYVGRRDEPQICKCANCGHERPLPLDFPIADGDRIWVDKLGRARRWELVVFNFPEHIDTNYLKRLVGLPGETVEIIGGDIFIDGRRAAKPFGVAPEMWILVNDTGHTPADMRPDEVQWRAASPSSHWQRAQNIWKFSGTNVAEEELAYSGQLTDESYYSERWADDPSCSPGTELQPIGDVRITCALRRFSGTGAFKIHWAFHGLEADATVSADGGVELHSENESRQAKMKATMSAVHEIGFSVRDGVLSLRADGQEHAVLPVGPQDAETVRESLSGTFDPCRIALAADHCEIELTGILVERDVHYRSEEGHCTGCTGRPIKLGAGEHFMLGDHSVRAYDSRLWQGVDERLANPPQVGTVPAELMIGVARCIYWPPDRWRNFR